MPEMPDDWWPDVVYMGATMIRGERLLQMRRALTNFDQSYLTENLNLIRETMWQELQKQQALQSANN